jgi:hypothetical protein
MLVIQLTIKMQRERVIRGHNQERWCGIPVLSIEVIQWPMRPFVDSGQKACFVNHNRQRPHNSDYLILRCIIWNEKL